MIFDTISIIIRIITKYKHNSVIFPSGCGFCKKFSYPLAFLLLLFIRFKQLLQLGWMFVVNVYNKYTYCCTCIWAVGIIDLFFLFPCWIYHKIPSFYSLLMKIISRHCYFEFFYILRYYYSRVYYSCAFEASDIFNIIVAWNTWRILYKLSSKMHY